MQEPQNIVSDDLSCIKPDTMESPGISKTEQNLSPHSNTTAFSLCKENEDIETVQKSIKNNETVYDNEKGISNWNELIEEEEENEKLNSAPITPKLIQNVHITDWLPPHSFSSSSFYAIATFVDYEACIYLHEAKLESVLRIMEENMKAMFDNFPTESPDTVWVPGQLCTVKYHVNDSWYRGKITAVNGNLIKVRMIDYGNEEDCEHEELRSKVMYLDIPAFANKIQLHNVFPKAGCRWSTSYLDELHKKVVECKIHVQLKEDTQQLYVATPAIVKVNNVNINEYMLARNTNLVTYSSQQKHGANMSDTGSDDVIIEEIYCDNSLVYKKEPFYKHEELDMQFKFTHSHLSEDLVGQNIPISIVSIHSYNKFVFEVLTDMMILETKDLFEKISESIKKEALFQPHVDNPTVGSACISKFSEDGEWYRAEVVSIDDEYIGVWFVDFGNFENVLKENVRMIKNNWLQLPVLQYKGQLKGLVLSDEKYLSDVLKYMAQSCGIIKTANILSVNPIVVQLFDDNQTFLYQELIDRGLLVINNESEA